MDFLQNLGFLYTLNILANNTHLKYFLIELFQKSLGKDQLMESNEQFDRIIDL